MRLMYLAAGSRSKTGYNRAQSVERKIIMPRTTRRPLDERARARLRDAQRVESNAVAAVHSAVITKESARAKLDEVVAKHQGTIDETDHALSKAQAQLVSVSGIERAALLLEQSVATLRAAVRSTKGEAREKPS